MIQENEVRKLKLAAEAEERKLYAENAFEVGCRGTEIGCRSRGTEIKIGGRSRGTDFGCREKEIGCRGSGTRSGEKTQAGDGKAAIRK